MMLTFVPQTQLSKVDISRIVAKANALDLFYLGGTCDLWQLSKSFQAEQFMGISYMSFVQGLKAKYDPNSLLIKDWV